MWALIALAASGVACGSGVAHGADPQGAEADGAEERFRDGASLASSGRSRSHGGDAAAGDPSDADEYAAAGDGGEPREPVSTAGQAEEGGVHSPGFPEGPAAGNSEGACAVPSEAQPVDTSNADNIVGDGSPESCTADAFVDAVARGGIIRFDCGPDPVTITLDRPAKVRNDASDDVVIDGEGKVTLSGGGRTRILYMNTCDPDQVWTTDHCDNQATPRLTVQNLTFVDASSEAEEEYDGGGAIWVRGGRFKVIGSRFFNNRCASTGPDVGGGALRVFSQYEGRPVYVVNSTFGGADGLGNVCSNGGGLSSIGVSWTLLNSVFSHNQAIGEGGNPAQAGTPGGGSGGAVYNDGNTMTLSLCGTRIEHNQVNAYGSAIFFVSNSHTGTLRIEDSVIRDNSGGGWNVLPGISMHEDTEHVIRGSVLE